MLVSLNVLLPEKGRRNGQGELPVLYLLHGLSDDHTAWVRRTNIDRYAQEAGIAVVMPEVPCRYYTDMRYSMRYSRPYFAYITQELPELCRQLFRISDKREDVMIAGVSTGGYGALKMAVSFPERFCAAASFSGAVERSAQAALMEPAYTVVLEGEDRPENDLFALTAVLAAVEKQDKPQLFLTCGLSDPLYLENLHYRAHLDRLQYPYTYAEWAGGHDWEFWDASLRKAIDWRRNQLVS